MTQNRNQFHWLWLGSIALVAISLLGCGSEPRPAPPPAPLPPAFQPDVVVVDLGEHGGKTTLISTEAGGWTRNGEGIESGVVVRGENSAEYVLTLSDGRWTAEFSPPDPVIVALGASGSSVQLQLLENGRYELDGELVASGQIWTAANAHRYRFEQSAAGAWTATFVGAPPISVRLGDSGDTVEIESIEGGRFQLDGEPLLSGSVRLAANGNRYRFLLRADGSWTTEFVPLEPAVVLLGMSGETVLVSTTERGGFLLNGQPLWSGQVRTVASGGRYRFRLAADGTWTASYLTTRVEVPLGIHGGTITLVRQEDGSYLLDSTVIPSGSSVTGDNGHEYTLTFVEGQWRAQPEPLVISITLPRGAGAVRVTRFEDGTYFYEGEEISTGDSISVRGVSYILSLFGTQGTARRPSVTPPDPGPPVGPGGRGPLTTDSLVSYEGVRPRLRDDDGTGTRDGSILEINGEFHSLADLSAYGWVDEESTFVESARERISSLLEGIEVLLGLSDSSLNVEIERRWDEIVNELDALFPGQASTVLGVNAPKERNGRTIDGEELVEDINDVLAALGSLNAFEDALDRGIFRSAQIDEDDVEDIFGAAQSVDRLGFAWTENTRFGAYSRRDRTRVTRSLSFPSGDEGIGAFAYSPLGRTRTSDLPVRGEALYRGETIAASGGSDQAMYRGEIELNVRFSTREVSGLVTNLRDRFGDAWYYGLRDVGSLALPAARISSSDGSFQSTSTARAYITYPTAPGGPRPLALSADFEGQFVGTGRGAGEASIGTWQIRSGRNIVLTAAFGAEYRSIADTILPPATDDAGEISRTSLIARPDSEGNIEIAARDAEGDRIEVSASELFDVGEVVITGDRLLALANDAINQQLQILNVYIDIEETGTSLRTTLWNSANEALEDHVFGPSDPYPLQRPYPSGRSRGVRDERAVETLQEVLHALSSPTRFEDSLGEGGVFEGVLGSEERLDEYDFDAIYDALDYEVEVQFGHTNYGRFGAWAKVARDYAVSSDLSRLPTSEAPDVFAYSPIQQTAYSTGDPNFPRNFTATYLGQTRAVDRNWNGDRPQFYDGEIDVTVQWANNASGSQVHAVIRDLAGIIDGSPFVYNGYDVAEIVISGMVVSLDSERRIGFSSVSPTVRIRYYDFGQGRVEVLRHKVARGKIRWL